jgi:hypothetical protein
MLGTLISKLKSEFPTVSHTVDQDGFGNKNWTITVENVQVIWNNRSDHYVITNGTDSIDVSIHDQKIQESMSSVRQLVC